MKNDQSDIEYSEFLEVAYPLEKEWRKKLPKYSDRELVDMFPESREIVPLKLKEWEELLKVESISVKRALVGIYKTGGDDFSIWFGEYLVKTFLFPEVEACQRHIERLQRLSRLFTKRSRKEQKQELLMEDAIQKAKNYSIERVAGDQLELKACGSKYFSRCPFHEEKHASFFLYPETNTYHCFGCQAHGDVINLTMHLYGLSFREAVSMLIHV